MAGARPATCHGRYNNGNSEPSRSASRCDLGHREALRQCRVGARRLPRVAARGLRTPPTEPGVHLSLCTGLSIDVDDKAGWSLPREPIRSHANGGEGDGTSPTILPPQHAPAGFPPAVQSSDLLHPSRAVFPPKPPEDGPPDVMIDRGEHTFGTPCVAIEIGPSAKDGIQPLQALSERPVLRLWPKDGFEPARLGL